MKKIIVLANTSWYLINFRLNLMLALQSKGYEVVAIAPTDTYSTCFAKHGIRYVNITMDNHGINPLTDSVFIINLLTLFNQQKPTVILSFTPKCNIYAGFAAGLLNIPIINTISGLGTAFINVNWLTYLVQWLYKLALLKSTNVFFQNKDDLALFLQHKLIKQKQIALISGSGVDVDRFSPAPIAKNNNKSNGKPFIFLCVARLLKEKGIIELVEATRSLKQEYPTMECHLLGELDITNPSAISANTLQTWIDEGIITYLGMTDNVLDFLRQADCVILPSYREGVPRSLLEAASVGKPIITTNAVGCREVVDDGINGFLCAVKDSAALKQKMLQILLLPEMERLTMGKNGRDKMLKQFTEQSVINHYIDAIEQCHTC